MTKYRLVFEPVLLQSGPLELLGGFIAGGTSIALNFLNSYWGLLLYIIFLPIKVVVGVFFNILLNTVTITPEPRNSEGNLAIFGSPQGFEGDSTSVVISQVSDIATGYMEPIAFIIVFVGIGIVLFFRTFDVVLQTDFDAEEAQRRLLLAPILILLWIPIANIILALAAGLTDLFLSIDVGITDDIAGDGLTTSNDDELDYSALLNSFGPTDGDISSFDPSQAKIAPLTIGLIFMVASFLTFLVTVLAAFIRLFALYLLYAIGPLAISMWAFSWKKISDLGASYIRYFILLAIFPAPAALISKLAPIFIVTLETVVVAQITGGAGSVESSSGAGEVVNTDIYDTIGVARVVRAFGLLIVPLAVGFGPWVFVIGLGNAMTLAAGTAALGTAAATGGGALIASRGLSGAKGAAKKGAKKTASDAAKSAKEKAGKMREAGVGGNAKALGGKAMSAGGKVRDYGGVAYDHRREIAESIANSRMVGSAGGLGRAIQGGAGMYAKGANMKEKASEKGGQAIEEASDKRERRNTVLENYSTSERFAGDGVRDRLKSGESNTLLGTYRGLDGRQEGGVGGDSTIGDPSATEDVAISEDGHRLEQSYAANNFNDERLKKHLARHNDNYANDWEKIDDETLESNRLEAFRGFTNRVSNRADELGISPEEYMRQEMGDRVAEDFADSVNPEYSELKEYGMNNENISHDEFQEDGKYAGLREEYVKEGNRGLMASEAQRKNFASFGVDDGMIDEVEKRVNSSIENAISGEIDDAEEVLEDVDMSNVLESYHKDGEEITNNGQIEDIIDESDGIEKGDIEDAISRGMPDSFSDQSDAKSYYRDESGEIQTKNKREINREVVNETVREGSIDSSGNIDTDIDQSVEDDIEGSIEETVRGTLESALKNSVEAVTPDDIDSRNLDDLVEMDKIVNDFVNNIDAVKENDIDTDGAEDFVREYMSTNIGMVTESVSRDANVERIVEETRDNIQTGEMKNNIIDSLEQATQDAINQGLDFDDMDVEAREELIDVQVADDIASNIESVAQEHQDRILDQVGKSTEDITTDDIKGVMDDNEDLRDDLRNQIEV